MDKTSFIQTKATVTAATAGTSFDISGIKGEWTVTLRVTALKGLARFSFPDSVDAFSGSVPGPSFNLAGDIGQSAANPNPIVKSFNQREWPSLRFGVASALLRCNLDELVVGPSGAAASVTYECFIQYQS